MLTLSDDPRFLADVTLNRRAIQAKFKVEFHLLDQETLEAARKRQQEGLDKLAASKETPDDTQAGPHPGTVEELQFEFTRALVAGWPEGQVKNERGEPLPFSDEALRKLLKLPGAAIALVEAFYSGYEEATEGNSAPPVAG